MPGLPDVVAQVRERIERYRNAPPINEQNTKAVLIDPMLRALGWDIEDVEEVHREYKLRQADNPVDYAILVMRTPHLFIEAKALGENLDDRRWAGQIMGYASVAGVEWVVLTNGDEYRIYNAHAAVPVDEKLFRAVRLSENAPLAEETLRLLSKEQMTENALDTLWQAYFVDRQIRAVVEGLFAPAPDPALVRLVARRLPKLPVAAVRSGLSRARLHLDFPQAEQSGGAPPLPRPVPRPSKRTSERPPGDAISLRTLIEAGLIRPPLQLTKRYKGKLFTATLEANGAITFDGRSYSSPSLAAGVARRTVIGAPPGKAYPPTNGWLFWHFRDSDGQLRPIDVLRARYYQSGREPSGELARTPAG